jgi:hypothetical protein
MSPCPSSDRTAQLLAAQHLGSRRVKLLNLSRNSEGARADGGSTTPAAAR